MAAARRRPDKHAHVQQEMLNKAGTAVRDRRGGYREGAGRKAPKGKRPSEPHRVRPAIKAREPQHVVIRVVRAVGSLRGFEIYQALRKATVSAARRETFRIVHISIQETHVHMLVEATDRMALATGMQGFQISAAKWINRAIGKVKGESFGKVKGDQRATGTASDEPRAIGNAKGEPPMIGNAKGEPRAIGNAKGEPRAIGNAKGEPPMIGTAKGEPRAIGNAKGAPRKGRVFVDRYFAESIRHPRYARRAIAYVLNNWRKHRQDGRLESCRWLVDPFSSGGVFDGWQDLAERGLARWTLRPDYLPLTVREPRTWLLREGWKRHGLIRCHEVPRTIR